MLNHLIYVRVLLILILTKIFYISAFFGRRECPNFNDINYENGKKPFAVLFRHPVTECKDDKECWPLRICCPEFAENDLESMHNILENFSLNNLIFSYFRWEKLLPSTRN